MTLRKTEEQEVRELLALRPTDDLSDEECRRVDEALRYSEPLRQELADYEKCLAVLHAAGAESSPTDDRPSLWIQVEPQLGPARRRFAPRRMLASIPTPWLTAAVVVLAFGNLYVLTMGRPNAGNGGLQVAGNPQPVDLRQQPAVDVGKPPGGAMLVNNRFPVLVDPKDERGRVRPLLGTVVVPCDGHSGGVEVSAIIDGSSAEEVGLQVGDILLECDGKKIRDPGCIIGCLKQHRVGQRIELVYNREGQEHKVTVFLGGVVRMGDREFLMKKSPIPPELIEQQLLGPNGP